MQSRTISIKAETFNYPTKEERLNSNEDFPKLKVFDFEEKNAIDLHLNHNIDLDRSSSYHNLYWWNNCLSNRIGKLHETFVYVHTHYHRGFLEDITTCSEIEIANKLQFEYYAELFYYFYVSTRDIVYQIVNLYCNCKILDRQVSFTELINKLNDFPEIKKLLRDFNNTIKSSSDIRNGFAHRFTPTIKDYRTDTSKINERISLSFKEGEHLSSEEIVTNINFSLKELEIAISSLKENMK